MTVATMGLRRSTTRPRLTRRTSTSATPSAIDDLDRVWPEIPTAWYGAFLGMAYTFAGHFTVRRVEIVDPRESHHQITRLREDVRVLDDHDCVVPELHRFGFGFHIVVE